MRAGEDLARGHVALAVGVDPRAALDLQAQVGPLGLDAQLRARESRSTRRCLARRAARATRRPGRGGRGTARARRARRTRRCPCRPAGPARASARSSGTSAARASPRASAPRRGRHAPSAPGPRRPAPACSPAPGCAATRRCPRTSSSVARGDLVEVAVAARPPRRPRPGRAARRAAAATRRARAARAGAPAAAARRASSSDTTCWPGSHLEAVAREQAGEGGGVDHGASHVREVLGDVLAQHVADPAALVVGGEAEAREQLLLARDRLGPGDLPAHGEALEEELDRALPGVLLGEQVAAERRGVLASRRAGVIAPRRTSVLPSASV